MYDDKTALKRIEFLVTELNRLTALYDEGKPEISDTDWDKLYFELQDLERQFNIYLPDSPTQSISYEVKSALKKVTHNHPMLSLDKTKDMREVYSFLGKHEFVAMCKMDGLTCSLRYLDGKLVSAETRGDGIIGEDILHNVLTIKSVPKRIQYDKELIVDGEIICTYSDFDEFKEEYQNPRNFAAGSIRLLDSNECAKRKLTFVAWDMIKGYPTLTSMTHRLLALSKLNFTVVPFLNNGEKDPREFLVKQSKELGYPIDGLVFKFDDIEYGEGLGETAHHKRNAIAFKFEDNTQETTLKYIAWTIGRTGVLTPVAVFEPIELESTIVERASLHNVSVMNNILGEYPYVNEPIHIFKANQIIPQVVPVDEEFRFDDYDDVPPWTEILSKPETCPYCGSPISYDKSADGIITANCKNKDCKGKLLYKLDYFCSKKGLDIKHISEETIQDLLDFGFVNNCADILNLRSHFNEWINKDGYGWQSVQRILASIDNAKINTTLNKFISSLGIDLIGENVSKELCKYFKDYESFKNACQNGYKFEQIPSFGDAKATALRTYDFTEADQIYSYFSNMKNPYYEDTVDEKPLEGMTIVITGGLGIFKNRDQMKEMIEKYGGKVAGSVSKNTNCLVNNDVDSTSTKNQKAKALGIEIISEPDFIKKYLDKVMGEGV